MQMPRHFTKTLEWISQKMLFGGQRNKKLFAFDEREKKTSEKFVRNAIFFFQGILKQ